MTKSVNVHEAKTHLSRLLDEVDSGEEIIIARAGKPCARLTAIASTPRTPGSMVGVWPDLAETSSFFDALPDDELDAWES